MFLLQSPYVVIARLPGTSIVRFKRLPHTSEDPDEMWSLRKFFRRLIEHELDHLEDLQIAESHWSHGTGLE